MAVRRHQRSAARSALRQASAAIAAAGVVDVPKAALPDSENSEGLENVAAAVPLDTEACALPLVTEADSVAFVGFESLFYESGHPASGASDGFVHCEGMQPVSEHLASGADCDYVSSEGLHGLSEHPASGASAEVVIWRHGHPALV